MPCEKPKGVWRRRQAGGVGGSGEDEGVDLSPAGHLELFK